MADTAKGTITAAIEAYQSGDPDEVLKEFHTNARVVGTKRREKWDRKGDVRRQLETDMDAITYSGGFVNSAVKPGELKRLGDGAMVFHRTGDITIREGKRKPRRVDARWTVVLQEYADGWKIRHSHFSFEE